MIISMHVDIYIQRHSRILIIQLNKLEASKHVTNWKETKAYDTKHNKS